MEDNYKLTRPNYIKIYNFYLLRARITNNIAKIFGLLRLCLAKIILPSSYKSWK